MDEHRPDPDALLKRVREEEKKPRVSVLDLNLALDGIVEKRSN